MKIVKVMLFVCSLLILVSCNGNVDEKLFVQNVITDAITFVVRDTSDTNVVPLSDLATIPVTKGYNSAPNDPLDLIVTFTFPEGLTLKSDVSKDSNLPTACYNVLGNLEDYTTVTVYENASKGSSTLKVKISCWYPGNMTGILTFTFDNNALFNSNYKGPNIALPLGIVKFS